MSEEQKNIKLTNEEYEQKLESAIYDLNNYCNQLQQENQQLKERLQSYENPEDLTLMFMYCNEKSKDKIKELQRQLKQRDEVIDEIRNKVEEYVTEIRIKTNSVRQFKKYMELPIIIRKVLDKYKGDNK